jgi:glycosyltransferase involved in cell wall biosynthesis
MLVDNGVEGDSRVQKSARSAADAGWDVILLGRDMGGARTLNWKLGRADVRLLPASQAFTKRREDFRRPWLAAPLAYPATGVGAYRKQAMSMWAADLKVRRAAAKHDGASRTPLRLRAEGFAARVTRKWVGLRNRQTSHALAHRKAITAPWHHAYTGFWRAALGNRSWRRVEPQLWNFELTFAKTIDDLQPDVIHANDFRMLGVGARAKIRAAEAGRSVKLVWDVHEFLPGVKPRRGDHRWLPGNMAHEHEYARYADAVVTVSDNVAQMLRDAHHLRELPSVVLNAPEAVVDDEPPPNGTIREMCGLDDATPLVVYSGALAPQRGVATMIEAMPQLPDVHVALVVGNLKAAYVKELTTRADVLGAVDRLHVLPYVTPEQVTRFLATADAGVIPIHRWPNHEIQLITKFFEYSHARLPIIVSDVRTMADTVHETGQGEVFRAEDVADYARAVRAIVADPARYRKAYDDPALLAAWTWEGQAEVLTGVYARVYGSAAAH